MNDADLEKLTTKPAKLKPKFNRNVVQYEVVLNSGVKELKIDPMTRDCNASWTIVGIGTERTIPIEEGSVLTLVIEVTAEDGTSKQYSITVTSLSAKSALLSSINIRDYEITPKFSSNCYEYDCQVSSWISAVQINATTPDKNCKMKVHDVDENCIRKLNLGLTNVQIEVTSPDGTNTVMYNVLVQRNLLLYPLSLPNYQCGICSGLVYCPVSIKDDPSLSLFCNTCFLTVTRTQKKHPLTGKDLCTNFKIQELSIDEKISQQKITCPLQCNENIEMQVLGEHMRNSCAKSFVMHEKTCTITAGNLKVDKSMNETETCAKCSCAVRYFEKDFHMKEICSSNHTYKFEHKLKPHLWEKKYEQEVIANEVIDATTEGEKFEEAFYANIAKGDLQNAAENNQKAIQMYAHAIASKSRDHKSHFRLGLIMHETFYATDIYGMEAKDKKKITAEDDGLEFQTEESMIDDIKALTRDRGYNASSDIDQLKALDEEYHTLLDKGQSEKADYVQKLYAFKQKQKHQDSANNNVSNQEKMGSKNEINENIYKAYEKYLDAASVDTNNAVYHMYVGMCLLLQREYDKAIQRFKCSISIKPNIPETNLAFNLRFYLAVATSKADKCETYEAIYRQFLIDGLNLFMYNHLHNSNTVNIVDNFSSIYNILFYEGISELAKFLKGPSEPSVYGKENLLQFISMLSFYGMSCIKVRRDVFLQLQLVYLQAQFSFGQMLMESRICKTSIKKYWDNLLGITIAFCQTNAVEVLDIQKKICQSAVILSPRSSKALCRLADILYSISSSDADMEEIEKLYKCSIDLEGKNINEEQIPKELLETKFWKDCHNAKSEGNLAKSSEVSKKQPTPVAASTVKRKVASPAGKKLPANRATPTKPTGRGTGAAAPRVAVGRQPVTKSTTTKATTPPKKCLSRDKVANLKQSTTKGKTTSKEKVNTEPEKKSDTTNSSEKKLPTELNQPSSQSRLGLARILAKKLDGAEQAENLYKEVIKMAPELHDPYIELGEMYARSKPLKAVDIYVKYPFSKDLSYDDAFLYGEIVRILMKEEKFDDERLLPNMVALGKIYGFPSLDKYVAILENKLKYNHLLRKVYVDVNGKSEDDDDVKAFFKFKLWQ